MFTLRQIASAGFVSVYAGCVTLTVNLLRIPYRRGAYIGVGFGALMHVVTFFLFVIIALMVGQNLDDPLLKSGTTWGVIGACLLVIQVLSAIGCRIMGAYFLSPRNGHETFDRQKLYNRLKPLDTGKRSVLHDVVTIMENTPEPASRKISSLWIVFLGVLSLGADIYWADSLVISSLDALFFGVPMDVLWWLGIAGKFAIPLVLLVAVNLAMLTWLNRDLDFKEKPV